MKAGEEKEAGFTLIELLVVMIIIGILAAIAIPVFLSQREKARDTATKSDVTRLGKEIQTYYVDGKGSLTLTQAGGMGTAIAVVDSTVAPDTYIVNVQVSKGTVLQASTAGASGLTASSTNWCVGLSNASGDRQTFVYKAATGLGAGSCS